MIATLRRRLTPTSFRTRILVSTVAVVAAVMVVAGIAVQIILARTASSDIESRLDERTAAALAVISEASRTSLTVPAESLTPGVVVYDDAGRPVAGVMDGGPRPTADRLGMSTSQRSVGASDDYRLRATPFRTASGVRGVVVVSQEVTAYERSESYALIATVLLGLVMIASTAFATRRVTTQALRPVTQMAHDASQWSEHDLTRRFDLTPADDELTALGDTLDQLLDRVAAALRAEQRLTAELAHELRTPLTAIQGSADLALMRGVADDATRTDLEQVSASARSLAEVITALLDVAREPVTGSSARCTAADLVEPLAELVPAQVRFVDRTAASTAAIAAPAHLVVRALAPLVDNAVRHARGVVTVSAADATDTVTISVTDDGPGVPASLRQTVFDPGASTDERTGLGLGITRRVVRSLGGEVSLGDPAGGASFTVRLPRA